ncbi:MAG: LytTR family transcriptional regulator, partial [Oscillospiraceae bacterium]|nr:LytTR family transcriptional regulator [Oscillospiraceae bacterium]
LSDSGFIRIHKGFLVNQAAVKMLTSDEAELINGTRIPIGRSYSETAKKQLMRYMLK